MGRKPKRKYRFWKWLAIILIIGVVVGGGGFLGYKALSAGGDTKEDTSDGNEETYVANPNAPWADNLVDFQVLTSDKYTGADESATIKVFDEMPEDWLNPRGTFTDSSQYTQYTASSGVVTINKEKPGYYYLVGTVSGSNTEFMTITIPDGTGRGDLSDYNQEPDAEIMEFSAVGSTTDEDFAHTLVNGTDKSVKDTMSLTVADDTEFIGWKVIVDDTEGFSIDTDGDGTYDEGIKKYIVNVCGVQKTVFEPAKGVDLFDSNDEYSFDIPDCEVEDGNDVTVKVELTANTEDGAALAANDELWSEGEGVLSYIKIYDNQGNLFATSDVTA